METGDSSEPQLAEGGWRTPHKDAPMALRSPGQTTHLCRRRRVREEPSARHVVSDPSTVDAFQTSLDRTPRWPRRVGSARAASPPPHPGRPPLSAHHLGDGRSLTNGPGSSGSGFGSWLGRMAPNMRTTPHIICRRPVIRLGPTPEVGR